MRVAASNSSKPFGRAFTLIELLVSMTVLTLLIVAVSQVVSNTTAVTVGNRKHLDADTQARVVFDRMALDLGKAFKRSDVHYLFAKVAAGSDKMFFYSEAPALYDPAVTTAASTSSVALVGYRVNAAFQLERLGKSLTWDGSPGTGPGGMIFLSPPLTNAGGSFAPDNSSLLSGAWATTIGTGGQKYDDGSDNNYYALADNVFRLEFCYQLLDGTYATVPVLNSAAVNNNLTATQAPTRTNDQSSYSVGSRWYDQTNNCAYVCTNSATGAAVWKFLGMQDVRNLIVTIAILDGTSSKTLPTTTLTVGPTQAQHQVQVPQLTSLVSAFADAPLPTGNTGEIGNSGTTTAPYFPPTPPSGQAYSTMPRLMAEAWNNELRSMLASNSPPVNKSTLAQVRIYQRCFPINFSGSTDK